MNDDSRCLPVRVMHSQASTGATSFARVIASLPNVFLLNEVSPAGHRLAQTRFNAMDPLEQVFARRSGVFKLSDEQHADLFCARLRPVLDHCRKHGLTLVIRDHSHSDYYMVGEKNASPSLLKALARFEDEIELRSLMFVRYPLASYMTARASHFLDHIPHYQNYCARYLKFNQDYNSVQRVRYEDFTENPPVTLERVCEMFDLEYTSDALRNFNKVVLSGNSGRYADDDLVHPTLMRDFGSVARDFGRTSELGQKLCKALGYPLDPAEFARNSAERVLRFDPNSIEAQEAYDKWSAILTADDGKEETS